MGFVHGLGTVVADCQVTAYLLLEVIVKPVLEIGHQLSLDLLAGYFSFSTRPFPHNVCPILVSFDDLERPSWSMARSRTRAVFSRE